MNTITLFHGSHQGIGWKLHKGACLTSDQFAAERYAGPRGTVFEIQLPADLHTQECEGYDWESNDAPADSESFRNEAEDQGVDVLIYDDADESGNEHDCYRIVSEDALASAIVSESE